MRKLIWKNRNYFYQLKNCHFYYSSKRPPKPSQIDCNDKIFEYESKNLLFDSMFTICIENIREYNYFTEKIIDAFSTYTIPIYYGCPNIGDYFDANGIIIVETIQDLYDCCLNLSSKDYYEKMNSIINNNKKSLQYNDAVKNIYQIINNAVL